MPKSLTNDQIKQRLQEGRNYKRLYFELKGKYDTVVAENQQLKTELAELKELFQATVERQQARIEELETMVFGRKPKGGSVATTAKPLPKRSRAASSYRRPIPDAQEVTSETYHPVSDCHRCGGPLSDIDTTIRYVADIVLAAFADTPLKTVEKQTIERGWCSRCGQRSAALDLRGQAVHLGPNVRLLVTYLSTIQGLTYSQVQMLLQDIYSFNITDGEIATILTLERQTYLPMYEELKDNIRAGPGHFDESRYRIQSEQNAGYAFAMAGADGTPAEHDIVFRLADSRGKGHAEALAGPDFQSVGITDRYGAYKHMFVLHQVCWVHLHRAARDLTKLECLDNAKRRHVAAWYRAFSTVYGQLRQYHGQPFDRAKRHTQAAELLQQVEVLYQPHPQDPKKLTDLKAGMLEYQDALFVCLTEPDIPADNNKAERAIRKLVLKRVRSFGVKTKRGAQVLEVLLSVAWSLHNRDRTHFFQNMRLAAQAA